MVKWPSDRMMKGPTALAPFAMIFLVVAPFRYGLEDPYRPPSAHSRYFVFVTRLYCSAFVSLSPEKKKDQDTLAAEGGHVLGLVLIVQEEEEEEKEEEGAQILFSSFPRCSHLEVWTCFYEFFFILPVSCSVSWC